MPPIWDQGSQGADFYFGSLYNVWGLLARIRSRGLGGFWGVKGDPTEFLSSEQGGLGGLVLHKCEAIIPRLPSHVFLFAPHAGGFREGSYPGSKLRSRRVVSSKNHDLACRWPQDVAASWHPGLQPRQLHHTHTPTPLLGLPIQERSSPALLAEHSIHKPSAAFVLDMLPWQEGP